MRKEDGVRAADGPSRWLIEDSTGRESSQRDRRQRTGGRRNGFPCGTESDTACCKWRAAFQRHTSTCRYVRREQFTDETRDLSVRRPDEGCLGYGSTLSIFQR